MADFTFPCPHCQQHIQCDDAWSGHQIQCPLCQKTLVVPQPAPVVPKEVAHLGKQLVAPPKGGSKLSAGATQVARSSFGAVGPNSAYKKVQGKKRNPAVTLGIIGAVLVAVAAAVYFGLPYLQKAQDDFNAKQRQAAKDSGGGEAGHIAEVVGVLDATDPNRSDDSAPAKAPRKTRGEAPDAGDTSGAQPAPQQTPQAMPAAIVPPVWTLAVERAKIPESKANGSISGTNFVLEAARLDRTASGYVLTLRQGTNASPDRGVMVYLKSSPGEVPTNKTYTVSQDMKGSQVTKLWKTNPRYAAQTRNYFSGYAMKLELGSMNDTGVLTGKIYLALPDTEQSVVGGLFTANTAIAAATPTYESAPQESTAEQKAADSAFRKRYGIRR